MKHVLPFFIGVMVSLSALAQTTETVSIGSGYSDHVWYSLADGEVTRTGKDQWDIAFSVSGFGSSILLNHLNENSIWVYPNGDTAAWATIDTSGISSWTKLYNSDTSWNHGAFNANTDPNDNFDLGWGVYNMITHQVVGDSLFILQHGNTFKKLWIEGLAGGVYSVLLANLDGSQERQLAINKANYGLRNFVYYSVADDAIRNLEPLNDEWDLQFTQYTTLIPMFGGYPATGVLQNGNVTAAQVYPVADPFSYDDHENHNFSTEINTIGHDWKSFAFATNQWSIADSTVYFVRARNGSLWRFVFTGFGGSATGDYIFHKALVEEAPEIPQGIDVPAQVSLQLYPNPSSQGWINLIYGAQDAVQFTIHDLQGRTVYADVHGAAELNHIQLSTQNWSPGVYIVRMQCNGQQRSEKLIIN